MKENNNVIVTGTPGAWCNIIAGLMADRGWAITWPEQDTDIRDGKMFLEHNRQNIEIQNIHQALCDQHGCALVDTNLPKFYDVPYPGPKEFLAKFDKPVVLTGTCMSPFLDLWIDAANVVIDIQATPEEDIDTLNSLTRQSYAPKQLEEIRESHVSRYNEHLKLFPKVFTMTNAEVRDRRVDGLVRFLNSVF